MVDLIDNKTNPEIRKEEIARFLSLIPFPIKQELDGMEASQIPLVEEDTYFCIVRDNLTSGVTLGLLKHLSPLDPNRYSVYTPMSSYAEMNRDLADNLTTGAFNSQEIKEIVTAVFQGKNLSIMKETFRPTRMDSLTFLMNLVTLSYYEEQGAIMPPEGASYTLPQAALYKVLNFALRDLA
jgi:hypothetical protein